MRTNHERKIMTEKLNVSLVICVYTEDRWDDICAAVESCRRQTTPPMEIIVSVDHNRKLYERVQQAMPDVIVVENKEQRGLSGARNSGIEVARGDVIAYLDDDAAASTDWLERLTLCLQDPQVMGAGGVVEPRWEASAPAWFPKEFHWVVGCSYLGLPEEASPIRNLFGGCMCVRKEVFEKVGYFRSGIGRDEKRPMGCEETELCIRANQYWPDRMFYYEPRAWAYHRVPPSRGTFRYFLKRCYSEGLSKAMVTREVGLKDSLSSERSYALHILPMGVALGLRDGLLHRDLSGFGRAGAIAAGLAVTTAGYVVGSFKNSWRALSEALVFNNTRINSSVEEK